MAEAMLISDLRRGRVLGLICGERQGKFFGGKGFLLVKIRLKVYKSRRKRTQPGAEEKLVLWEFHVFLFPN